MATTKYFREYYNYTQKELSKEYNIPLATIKNWESRNCAPDYIINLLYRVEINQEKRYEAEKNNQDKKRRSI